MSVRLTSAPLELKLQSFLRNREILSGDGADQDTEERGARGISTQLNYAYSRGRVLLEFAHPRMGSGDSFNSDVSGSWVDVVERNGVYIGADVTTLTAKADITDGQIRIIAGATTGTASASVLGRSTHTATVAVTGGATVNLKLQFKKDAGASSVLAHSGRCKEADLGSGDLP